MIVNHDYKILTFSLYYTNKNVIVFFLNLNPQLIVVSATIKEVNKTQQICRSGNFNSCYFLESLL